MTKYLIKARLVKEHYRKLPNGRIIHIDQHWDKRDKAKEDFNTTPHNVLHVDDKGTTVVGGEGKQRYFPHSQTKEMSKEQIHAHLNNKMVIPDLNLAMEMVSAHYGIHNYDDFKRFLEGLPGENLDEQQAYYMKEYVDPMIEKNAKEIGDVMPISKAYTTVPHYKEYIDEMDKHNPVDDDRQKTLHDLHQYATVHMTHNHAEDAVKDLEEEEKGIRESLAKRPEDAPKIPYISKKLSFFPHQAEVMAKLDVMFKGVIDVDMGGGKGLLLPADALNLMAKGKIKKPLIVAPGNTLNQNAKKMLEYTDGNVNVFLITNGIVKSEYGGDVQALVEDIDKAPPNTVFMASYDVFARREKPPEGMEYANMHQDDLFARGLAISGADFDYVACFPKGTKVMTIEGYKPIEQVKIGDRVLCAKGWGTVSATQSKLVDREVTIGLSNGVKITCSDNHPFLTSNGWTRADALKNKDVVITAAEAMRILQKGLFDYEERSGKEQILFKVLFGELQSIPTWISTEKTISMGENEDRSAGEISENSGRKISKGKREQREDDASGEEQKDPASRIQAEYTSISWREWIRPNESRDASSEYIGERVGMELSATDKLCSWQRCISDLLQDGFSSSEIEDLCGSGWQQSLQQEGSGSEKRRISEAIRVESVEIAERECDRKYAGMPFYDLKVDGHPSFVVEGLLVHNCDESHSIKNTNTVRFKAMQYLTGAKYRRIATGTFVSNEASDVYGQLKWLYPAWDISEEKFKKKYGYREIPKVGKIWLEEGLKQLREDLLEKGMISLRRSAWLDKLPERQEKLSIVKMDKKHDLIHNSALEEILDSVEEDLKGDLDYQKRELYDEVDKYLEDTPRLKSALETLSGITDFPDIVADMVEGKYDTLVKFSKEMGTDMTPDIEEATSYLNRYPPDFRKTLLGLKGQISPKAKDIYKKLEEHFKDPKNGKYIVFCQRKFSAAHIMAHMPEHLKKDAIYYDASRKDDLDKFINNASTPRIIVAVDCSIKEGMNLQMANGMYRYDHHWVPGSQEQSYARIWRFGQDKPVKIHLGLVDGGVDVPKYCRMISKYHQNMQVISEYPQDKTFMIYKMNVKNIRQLRDASNTAEYEQKMKDILAYEKNENRKIKQSYGDKGYTLGSSAPIRGGVKKKGKAYYDSRFERIEEDKEEQGDTPKTGGKKSRALPKKEAPPKTKPVEKPIVKVPAPPKKKPVEKVEEKPVKEKIVTKLDHNKIIFDTFKEAGHNLDKETVGMAVSDLKKLTKKGEPDAEGIKAFWNKWTKEQGDKPPKPYMQGINAAVKKMFGKVKKSILGALGYSDALTDSGQLITSIGVARLKKVRSIIADGVYKESPVKAIARKLRREVSAKRGEKWRNWDTVAQTEVTDVNGKSSYELLRQVHGKGDLIYRDTYNCCPCEKCESLFGPPGKPIYWRVGQVNKKYRGALHPNCRCSHWKSVDEPGLFKAAPYVMGLVKREFNSGVWQYFISDGKGKWFALDSISGLGLVRYILKCVPYVYIAEKGGYNLARHGHGRPEDNIIRLLSARSIGNARFYPANPFEQGDNDFERREYFMKESHTLDAYLDAIMKILPAVVKMPEYWQDGKKIHYLTDFMGYITLTNWWVLIPGKIPEEAVVFTQKEGHYHDTHTAVRLMVKNLMMQGELRKD